MKLNASRDFGRRECPSCACEVAANQNRCPICSYEFPHPTASKRNLKLWGALIMLLLFALMVLRIW